MDPLNELNIVDVFACLRHQNLFFFSIFFPIIFPFRPQFRVTH